MGHPTPYDGKDIYENRLDPIGGSKLVALILMMLCPGSGSPTQRESHRTGLVHSVPSCFGTEAAEIFPLQYLGTISTLSIQSISKVEGALW